MSHIIIGSGITGLYTAYKLIKKKKIKPENILIFEKSNRIGGRIYTYENDNFKYSVGAGRLGKKHKYVMKLLKDFNLENEIIDIKKDKLYFIDNILMNEKELLKYYNSKFKSLNDLWKYALTTKTNINTKEINLHNYFSTILSTSDVKILQKSLNYISEMYDMNAYNALNTLKKDFDVENNDFFILKSGLHIICDKLYEYLIKNKVSINLNNDLKDIDNKKKIVYINNKNYKYDKVYLTIKRNDYLQINFFKQYHDIFNSVSDGNLLRIYAKYKNVWFKNIPKILTDNKLQFIIPIDYDNGLIQISYSDSYNANFWNNLENENIVKIQLNKMLKEIFPNKNIEDPEWITMHYWKAGVHFWNTGIYSKDIQNKFNNIFKKDNIYILGETYCNRQAWIDGALETVELNL
tara:strand:- start:2657 stop:3877 length:1221 start_codon:yes stop_codon:yes gene_type:complete